ncbi:MAG: nucleotidyltransferase substrate binding protein [Desulfotignum sp.]|nr:nucleotidyltransferase substrate binding protein [Desulfotignum sp.]
MSEKDIRWIQRFRNYSKALGQLSKFIEKGALNELEKQGLIQAFEYTYELAWNTIKDYFENQGETGIHGSRDALRLAFRRDLVDNGQAWMDMIKSRTLTTHTYNQEVADAIADAVFNIYYTEFVRLEKTFQTLKKKDE